MPNNFDSTTMQGCISSVGILGAAQRRVVIGVLLAVTLSAATGAVRAEMHELKLSGQLVSAAGERSVTLKLVCDPDPNGGALSMELWVPQAYSRKDFDYDDFEGPDAPAAERDLSHIAASGGSAKTEIDHSAAGWYSGEDPDTFVFGLSQLSRRPGKVATLLEAISPMHTELLWVQTAFDASKRTLRAHWRLDAAGVKRIHETVDSCLTPKSQGKKK